GTLTTSNGGRLLVAPASFSATEPVALHGVELATDVYFSSGSYVSWSDTRLAGDLFFNNGIGEIQLYNGAAIGGMGTLRVAGGVANLRASGGTVGIGTNVAIRATSGTLSLGRKSGDTTGAYYLDGPAEAAGGAITFAAPVMTENAVDIHDRGQL